VGFGLSCALRAFWLELDNPSWAGISAALVCQPQLGASLRKGWYRMIGTVIGAIMIVVLTGWFPQDRFAFLGLLITEIALGVGFRGTSAFSATFHRVTGKTPTDYRRDLE
jgi:uncharacterized membrane protein YccC